MKCFPWRIGVVVGYGDGVLVAVLCTSPENGYLEDEGGREKSTIRSSGQEEEVFQLRVTGSAVEHRPGTRPRGWGCQACTLASLVAVCLETQIS